MSCASIHIEAKGIIVIIALSALALLSPSLQAQNTKGDKPAVRQNPILRIPKIKSKKKGGDKAYTRDISGRKRIRTKNQSTAAHAVVTKPSPYRGRKSNGGDRPYKPQPGRISPQRSSSAQAARNNVFPNRGKFIQNPSSRPHDNQHVVSNRQELARARAMQTKPRPPIKKKIITGRTASRSYVTPGRKNVYWGKFKVKERPVTTDISGRPLRARNFHSPALELIPAKPTYRTKKVSRDRPYQGPFISGYGTDTQPSRAWRGNISGNPIRTKPPKVSQTPGRMFEPRKLSITKRREGAARPLKGSGFSSRSGRGRSSEPIQGKGPGLGGISIERFLSKLRGPKRPGGGIKSTNNKFNNNGRPIDVKGPGIGARFVDKYQGNILGQKGFSQDGYGFAGSFKTRRAPKGGGSVSGKRWNNFNSPIDVKAPGAGARFVSSYRGNILGLKGFGQQGYGYSGSIKASRPIKGGGSISGRSRNNFGQPVNVKEPGAGARFVSGYRGNLLGVKGFSQLGYGYSGNIPRRVKTFETIGYGYSGNIKSSRPAKGGGSISDRSRNNFGEPINVRSPGAGAKYVSSFRGNIPGRVKTFETLGYSYSGSIKASRPAKGGGSVSGKLWNNNQHAIEGKSFSPAALKIGTYSGGIKAKRPEKGGGSVSGKLWNNNEQAIQVHKPASVEAQNLSYSGFIKEKKFPKKYIRNPNSKEEALKKERPDKSTYAVGGLQVRAKPQPHEHNRLSAKGALDGLSAGKNSLRAAEYSSKIKLIWDKTFNKDFNTGGRNLMKKYVHNPNSKKGALMVFAPSRADARIKDLQVNVKMSKPTGKNLHPDAKFANSYRDNVKGERTLLMNLKLKWAKLFKKNDIQPPAVKEKVRRPRYDKREKELWKDLYD